MNKKIFLALIPALLIAEVNTEIDEFQEIEVEASKYIQTQDFLKNAPMQKQITTKEALDIPGTNGDPLKAIKTFAGVVSTDNDNAEMIIHGSKPRETAFSINHLPLGYVFHMGGLHSVIAPEATSQIDAYLGGFDVTYAGMGAAIDITPQYPVGKNGGRIHLGMYDADFAIDTKITDNISMFVSARRSYFDLIATEIMDELYVDEDDDDKKVTFTLFPQFYDVNFMLNANFGNHMLSLEMITSEDEMKISSSLGGTSDPDANGDINNKKAFTTIGTRWMYYGDNYTANTLLYNLSTDEKLKLFTEQYVDVSQTTFGLNHSTIFDYSNHKTTIGFEIQSIDTPVDINITKRPQRDDVTEAFTGQEVFSVNKTYNAKVFTLFMQDIWSLSDDLKLRYGIRASKTDYNNFGSYIDPRTSLIYNINDKSTLSLSVGQYSQRPEDEFTIDNLGNPNLDTFEVSNHYALSFKHNFDDNTYIEVEPYYKDLKNLAIEDSALNYLSVGDGFARGLDITYRRNIDNLQLIVAYTFLDSKRDLNTAVNNMYNFYGEIPHTLQISSSYKFKSDWKVSSLFKYSSGKLYTPVIGSEAKTNSVGTDYISPITGEPFSKRLDDIYDLDIKVSKIYKNGDGTSSEHSIEFMNVTSIFRQNVADIKYDDNYNANGYIYQMGFIPAYHYTYRF